MSEYDVFLCLPPGMTVALRQRVGGDAVYALGGAECGGAAAFWVDHLLSYLDHPICLGSQTGSILPSSSRR